MNDEVKNLAKVALEEIRKILEELPNPKVSSFECKTFPGHHLMTSITLNLGGSDSLTVCLMKEIKLIEENV